MFVKWVHNDIFKHMNWAVKCSFKFSAACTLIKPHCGASGASQRCAFWQDDKWSMFCTYAEMLVHSIVVIVFFFVSCFLLRTPVVMWAGIVSGTMRPNWMLLRGPPKPWLASPPVHWRSKMRSRRWRKEGGEVMWLRKGLSNFPHCPFNYLVLLVGMSMLL